MFLELPSLHKGGKPWRTEDGRASPSAQGRVCTGAEPGCHSYWPPSSCWAAPWGAPSTSALPTRPSCCSWPQWTAEGKRVQVDESRASQGSGTRLSTSFPLPAQSCHSKNSRAGQVLGHSGFHCCLGCGHHRSERLESCPTAASWPASGQPQLCSPVWGR